LSLSSVIDLGSFIWILSNLSFVFWFNFWFLDGYLFWLIKLTLSFFSTKIWPLSYFLMTFSVFWFTWFSSKNYLCGLPDLFLLLPCKSWLPLIISNLSFLALIWLFFVLLSFNCSIFPTLLVSLFFLILLL